MSGDCHSLARLIDGYLLAVSALKDDGSLFACTYLGAQPEKEVGRLKLNSITRHMLGLMQNLPGARGFRQTLSDSKKLASGDPRLLLEAAARLSLPA